MPEAHKLQPWLTIRGPDSGTLIQDQDSWLDLQDYDDLVIWYEVADQSNVDGLAVETAPVLDETMFVSVISLGVGVTSGPRLETAMLASATVPLARYLRWKVTGRIGSSFSLTFRIWVVASRPHFPPFSGMLAGAPATATEDPELGWFLGGGDDALFDELTKKNLSILESTYGCNDGVVGEVRAELRRQALMKRAAQSTSEKLRAARRARNCRACECEPPPTAPSEEHVPVD